MTEEYIPRFPKPGIKRVRGQKMEALRVACFLRDRGRCKQCVRRLALTGLDANWDLPVMHLAHIQGKRNHGDLLTNVRALCPECHALEHAGGKPVPTKGLPDVSREA